MTVTADERIGRKQKKTPVQLMIRKFGSILQLKRCSRKAIDQKGETS